MLIQILVMALIGTLIGWFTNYLAVKSIFRPMNPFVIPLIGVKIQGLIPKRRNELARSIGITVADQLISMDDLLNRLIDENNKGEIIISIKTNILNIIQDRMPIMIPTPLREALLRKISPVLSREISSFMENSLRDIINKAADNIDIARIIENKVTGFDLYELEGLILAIAKKELKHIELLGGVLGFIIGTFQGILVQFL